MRIDKLEVGDIIKNYKELCKVLELKVKTGEAKQNQMKWIERYVSYEKKGYRFIINEISDEEVQPMEDGREQPIEYLDLLEKLILDLMLQDEENNRIYLSKTQMFRQLSLANENYAVGKFHIPELSELINVNQQTAKDWYNSTDSMLERHILRALKSLESQAVVVWSKVTTVDIDEIVEECLEPTGEYVYNSEGEKVETYRKRPITRREHREATDDEMLLISRAERKTLKSLGFKNKSQVIGAGQWSNFEQEVSGIIKEEGGINYYYSSYKILFHNDIAQERADELDEMILDATERASTQDELSTSIQQRVHDNALARQARARGYFGIAQNHRLLDTYIPDTCKLSRTFLDVSASDITDDIKSQS